MDPFASVPEQAEAKRLLAAALTEGGAAHAYLLHGPAGVGKRTAAFAFAGALLGDARRVELRTHPDLYLLEPLGRDDPHRRRARAAARPAHAPVRGRSPRLPRPRRRSVHPFGMRQDEFFMITNGAFGKDGIAHVFFLQTVKDNGNVEVVQI